MANNIFKKKDIKLDTFEDLNCKGVIASFSQGDRVSDKLLIRLTNDGVPLDLTDAVQVRIDFRKPDGKLVFQYCIMEDKPNGLISALLTTQTLAAPGKVYSEVTVKYPEGKDAVTRQFTFHVEEAIASDKSIESQNEWPMLERAIVAGDMLAGVDLVAIIQAGELAKGALPKTGGTMTGDISIVDTKGIAFMDVGAPTVRKAYLSSSGNITSLFDSKTGSRIWWYDHTTQTFTIDKATNVVKKAEAFTDYWTATGRAKALTSGTDLNTVQTSGAYAGSGLVNTPEGKTTFFYVEVILHNDARYCKQIATDLATGSPRMYVRNMSNNVWGAWQEVISSLGGTLSGNLNFATASQIQNLSATGQLVFGNSGVWINDTNGNFVPWQYRYSDKQFIVNADTNLAKKAGDTFTGAMTFNQVLNLRSNFEQTYDAAGQKGVTHVINNSTDKWAMGPKTAGTVDWSKEVSLNLVSGLFTVNALATKQDTVWTSIPLQPNIAAIDNRAPMARRTGDTVSIRLNYRASALTNSLVAVLPAQFRPSISFDMHLVDGAGISTRMTVESNGNISCSTLNQDIRTMFTFAI